jgi:hypothetical protein
MSLVQSAKLNVRRNPCWAACNYEFSVQATPAVPRELHGR